MGQAQGRGGAEEEKQEKVPQKSTQKGWGAAHRPSSGTEAVRDMEQNLGLYYKVTTEPADRWE